jgi:hypothetical protein
MKIKDIFATYEEAYSAYYNGNFSIVEQYGTTKLPWGFGKWLWMDVLKPKGDAVADTLLYWQGLKKIGILTSDGEKRLRKFEKGLSK